MSFRLIIGLLTLVSVFLFVNCLAASLNGNILKRLRELAFLNKGLTIDAYLWICVVLATVILLATAAICLFTLLDGGVRL